MSATCSQSHRCGQTCPDLHGWSSRTPGCCMLLSGRGARGEGCLACSLQGALGAPPAACQALHPNSSAARIGTEHL